MVLTRILTHMNLVAVILLFSLKEKSSATTWAAFDVHPSFSHPRLISPR